MGLVPYTNIEDGEDAKANDINTRFGHVLAQVNGNLDASNIKNSSITRELLAGDTLLANWPVGSVYISVDSTNPSSYFGGSWVAFATGRTIVGVDSEQGEFEDVEKTGGSKTQTLTEANLPAHDHNVKIQVRTAATGSGVSFGAVASAGAFNSGFISNTGSGTAHNNLQPYITVYMFKRVL